MIDAFCNLEEIDGDEAWCDLTFCIVHQHKSFFSDRTAFTIEAVADGQPIGLRIASRAKDWEYQPIEDEDALGFWWGKLTLSSVGTKSDALLTTWRKYFNLPGTHEFSSEIECHAVALEGDPRRIRREVVRTKLFFDNGDSDEYAELFCNIDLAQGFAALNEKDPEYRARLLAWCSGGYGHA